MDVLLAHGYHLLQDPHEQAIMRPYPPLGMLYVSSYLKSRGFAVGTFDATFASPEAFASRLAQDRPPVVGLYTTLMTRPNVLEMIRAARAAGATVVLGGPDGASNAEDYLENGADVVVAGEGELTLEELLPHLAQQGPTEMQHIRGLIYREGNGQIIRTPPRPLIAHLDDLPLPDRQAIDLPAYLQVWREHHGAASLSLVCARGCPYTCAWCSHSVFGDTHRRRSPENVVAEVEQLVAAYHPDQLWYTDDVFTIHHSWLARYAALLEARGIRLPFECISRPDRLNEEVVRTLAEMGCTRLWLGAESGSQKVIDAMDRRIRVTQARDCTRLLQRYGIQVGLFIMLGYEGEDLPELEETTDFLKAANPDVFLTTVAYPIKGTRYYDAVADRVRADAPWSERTDRDLTVAGRHSKRFYSFATRWMVGEVNAHKLRQSPLEHPVQLGKAMINARVGRLGMLLTRAEVEA
jgi:anaerobic magnesium-protoporphyrin IX monomethyl ester cyclase